MSEKNLADLFHIPVVKSLEIGETLMVIEDQQDLRLIVTHHLNKLGFNNVLSAQNGYDALEVLRTNKKSIGVILCDMTMPVLGGIELLNEIREDTEIDRPPFCLMMENVSKEKVMLAVESGSDDMIVKPFTLNDVIPKLRGAHKVFHNPKNPEKVYELAKKNLRENNLEESLKIYQAIANSSPKVARPWVGMARIAIAQKDFKKALELCEEAEKRNNSYVHLYVVRAEVLTANKKFEEAVVAFKKAIELSPLNPVRYCSAADILFKLERYKEATEILQMASTHQLEFKELHHYLSQAAFKLKDYSLALRHVKSALNSDPDNVTYLNQLGICLKEMGQFDEAKSTYNRIIKLDPDNEAALYNKAVMMNSKGETPEAIKILERLVKKRPDFQAAAKKLQEYQSGGTKKSA